MPWARNASSAASSRSQSKVPSRLSMRRQSSVARTTSAPMSWSWVARSSAVPGPNISHASSVIPTFSPGAAVTRAGTPSAAAASTAHTMARRRAARNDPSGRSGADIRFQKILTSGSALLAGDESITSRRSS